MRDLYHNILSTQVLSPAVATTVKTSSTIDLQGHNSASVLFSIGQSGDTLSGSVLWTLKMQHSDDDSSYSDVTAADVSNGTTAIVINDGTLDETVYSMGYIGSKRYLKGIATPTGTHTNGTPIGMIALRGNSAYRPVVNS